MSSLDRVPSYLRGAIMTHKGSGITTERFVRLLRKSLLVAYNERAERVARTKVRAEDLKEGFRDGADAMLKQLEKMGIVCVLSEEEAKKLEKAS